MKVTTKTIAEICGVSRGTVDRALNGRDDIHPDTKKKILEAANKLAYRPNYLASSLSKGKTKTIGVIVFNLKNEFFSYLLNNIEAYAREMGYFVYITLTNKDPKTEIDCINHLIARKVDGLIIGAINTNKTFDFKNIPVPLVTINNKINDSFPYIGINDFEAQRQAVTHVASKGYDKIVFICTSLRNKGKANIYASEERYKGFLTGIKEMNLKRKQYEVIKDNEYPAYLNGLDYKKNKIAIMCSSDIYAIRVMNILRQQGLHVPEDVGVMGFDNIQMSQYLEPRLTTVEYPLGETAIKAVKYLIDLMEDRPADRNTIVSHSIIEGGTLRSYTTPKP